MSQWLKILNVGNNVCSPSQGQTCFKILNVGNNICNNNYSNSCVKINNTRAFWEIGIFTEITNQRIALVGLGDGVIDWGNGILLNASLSGPNPINNFYDYLTAGFYTIRLKDFPVVNIAQPFSVLSTSVIPESNILTCQDLFKDCDNLTSIPRNLFTNIPNVINFNSCFAGCTSLITVPSDLFANNLKANNFTDCFNNATLTTESYSNLLINLASTAMERPSSGPEGGQINFHGGKSKYNAAGQTARNVLQGRNWVFSDSGFDTGTWDIGIQTITANQAFGVQIDGTNINITIDWGNGTTQIFTTAGLKTIPYVAPGNYTIKISGSLSSNGNIRLGTINGQFVKSTSIIPAIQGLTNFEYTFTDCNALTNVPAGLFVNNPLATNFRYCFAGCTSLTKIPENLFANNPAITNFEGCFRNCPSIARIPNNLFINNMAVTNFILCFSNSTITTIPENLFTNNIAVTDFEACFRGCPSLTNIPSNLFKNNTAVTNFALCFSNTSLTNVPSDLFANNTAVTSFNGLFNGVTLTTTSYSNLLINMASNASSRQNNVAFGGGNSRYNSAGQTARQTLQAKNWTFSDLGLQT